MKPVNAIRGEVEVQIGDVTLVMRATLADLARLSREMGRVAPNTLLGWVMSGELDTVLTCIRLFTVEARMDGMPIDNVRLGVQRAIDQMTYAHDVKMQEALARLIDPLVGKPEDKEPDDDAAKKAAAEPSTPSTT